ncbi:hypothetical protein [Rhizobium sp. NRK18]|uniref:hypothetical protein n=1 Tax=Rhizobium sp. NRK18 TaxID=2964667 RepID=UPI0021C34671|nr:hypothetical protein [Rhizobium sp. NRK18]MCQ2004511.1 hypothetical protein [Rhizobium sp. NRK18]
MHSLFIFIFLTIHGKNLKIFKNFSNLLLLLATSTAISLLLLTIKTEYIYPGEYFDDQILWNSTIYVDFKPSYYFFAIAMVFFFAYSVGNIVYLFSKIEASGE